MVHLFRGDAGEGFIDEGHCFLTGGSYISKSDRPYAHSPGAAAASTRHSAGQQAIDDDHHFTCDMYSGIRAARRELFAFAVWMR